MFFYGYRVGLIDCCVCRIIVWSWEITFIPLWIVLCISLVGVLYTIIFAGILLRIPDVNSDQRRSSTNSALGTSQLLGHSFEYGSVLDPGSLKSTLQLFYWYCTQCTARE